MPSQQRGLFGTSHREGLPVNIEIVYVELCLQASSQREAKRSATQHCFSKILIIFSIVQTWSVSPASIVGVTRKFGERERSCSRLSNGFSRKVENYTPAVALNNFSYNFIQIHRPIHMSPALAAGVTDHVWSIPDPLS